LKIVSCPTCGRTDPTVDLLEIAERIDKDISEKFINVLRKKNKLITVAIMGCEVNGPGEASHADVGIAGARNGNFLLFSKGQIISKIKQAELINMLENEIEKLVKD
jgi:(E)-4-hydroxy-3-methylbut-2-enyl-diphosphate synthase